MPSRHYALARSGWMLADEALEQVWHARGDGMAPDVVVLPSNRGRPPEFFRTEGSARLSSSGDCRSHPSREARPRHSATLEHRSRLLGNSSLLTSPCPPWQRILTTSRHATGQHPRAHTRRYTCWHQTIKRACVGHPQSSPRAGLVSSAKMSAQATYLLVRVTVYFDRALAVVLKRKSRIQSHVRLSAATY